MSSCPNINSPEWEALVNKIGNDNAWREFLANGYIPSADNYDVIEPISKETTQQIKPGVTELFNSNPELADSIYESLGITPLVSTVKALTGNLGENIKERLEDYNDNLPNQIIQLGGGKYAKRERRLISSISGPTQVSMGEEVDYLTETIRKEGQKTPILIHNDGRLIEGRHRLQALKNLNEEYVDTVTLLPNNSQEVRIFEQKKQQAQQLYSQYIEQTGKQDIEGFKEFVSGESKTKQKDVLYSIKTKSVQEIAKGLNTDLIRSEQQIKYSGYIKSMVLELLGDIGPGKKMKMSPAQAFEEARNKFLEINNGIALTLNSHIQSAEDFEIIKNSPEFDEIKEFLEPLKYVNTYEDLIKAAPIYKNVVDDFNTYIDFVKIDLAHNGIRIVKNKVENIDVKEKINKSEDETDDADISQNEIGPRYDQSVFEVNPRDTASVRVKGLIQTIFTGEYEFGVPLYANPTDVFADILEIGSSINLSGFTKNKTKLNEFQKALLERAIDRPYLNDLFNKIENYKKNNNWSIINDILTVASKSYAVETILLYQTKRAGSDISGIHNTRIISSNRDTVEEQVSREWLFFHLQSDFYKKNATGDNFPKEEKINQLKQIVEDGFNKDNAVQVQKFKEFFDVLGIKFTNEEVKKISEVLPKELRKKDFNLFFAKNNLLTNIITSFEKNKDVPFTGQYGFQDETTSMKKIANIYYVLNPGKYKITSTKTADGKSKYAYILPTYLEQIKREWDKGNTGSVTNTALAKPNSEKETSFWKKVMNGNAVYKIEYFNGIREQKAGEKGKVRKSLTPKEQIVSMFLEHQQNLNVGSYISFTLSDKTTTMKTRMTKEFFVNTDNSPVGFNSDYVIENGQIKYTAALKKKVYNSFVEPEISRILASIKNKKSTNIENYEIASKLFYMFPNLNRNPNLVDFRNDLYSGKLTIEELSSKYNDVVAEAILNELTKSNEENIDKLISLGVIEYDKSKDVYNYPLFINGYKETDYVNQFRKTDAKGRNMARLMVMDMKLNYLNSQIKTIQFLKFDPALAFKTSVDVKGKSISDIDVTDRVNIANSTWDEFSKRVAALIAPGSQGNWFWNFKNGKEYTEAGQDYITVTGVDIKKEVTNEDGTKLNKSETTDAEELVTLQEHIDYLMNEGKIDLDTWESIYNKINKAGPGGYYTLDAKELGAVFSPIKPVYVNYTNVGDANSGLNRIDYIKSSRYPLIPQQEAGSERDKLRIWMEKNNVRSVNFGSGKKLGRPTKSIQLFDKDNNFIEPSKEDFESSKQLLSRSGLKNQQEIPDQKNEIRVVSQMNRTLFDGLLEVKDFNFGNMKNVSGTIGKQLKEKIRSRLFDIEKDKLLSKLGNLNTSHVKLYELLKDIILNDTTGSYTENDLESLQINPDTKKFAIPLEALGKLPKFQSLINSLINKNVMLKIDGSSFIQVSGVGAKFTFSKISKGIKSDIIWVDKHAKQFAEDGATLKYMRQVDGKTKAAQVIVSQYLRDEEGELIDLSNYIKEDEFGRKILDTSKMDEKMFQLIGTRIPNQSHPSTLPIEVVGFLPSYMENTIIVPDGVTGQMGSDFDVDKLYAYFSKFKYSKKTTEERLGANQEEYDELVESAKKIAKAAGEKEDKKGRYKNFNTYLAQAVKEKYGDKEVPKFKIEKPESLEQIKYDVNSIDDIDNLSDDQLKQFYRDIHWEVLMNPAAFSKITGSVDLPEVKSKVEIRKEQLKKYGLAGDVTVNLPLDYITSIERFIDNRSGKTGVGVFASLISAQADLQDKVIRLADEEGVSKPIKIKLTKNGKVIDLEFIGKLGESVSFLNKKRSISDNLNVMFSESVDNAKNQFLREFNWTDKAMSAVGFFAMLSDENGVSAPIEMMMDLTSQPSIIQLFNLIEQKQDSFGQFDSNAIKNSTTELQNKIILKVDNTNLIPDGITAETYFSDKSRNAVIDAESLAESWIIGKAITENASEETLEQLAKDFKYDSVNEMKLNYYNTQYNALDYFVNLEDNGRELMTILGVIYPYTKGIGSNVFSTKQMLNQLNKLSFSTNFGDLSRIAGEVSKMENGDIELIPVGEIGSAIQNSLIFAQNEVYKQLFPISAGEELESTVDNILNFMGLDKMNLSKDKYKTYYSTVFSSIISYIYTNPSFELFDDVIAERNRLINGKTSLGSRIIDLKQKPEYAKNGFLKYIEAEKDYKSDTYTISFKAPFGTEMDEKEISLGFYALALDENDEIKKLAKDLALYPYATGDAGYLLRFIPVGYYTSDSDFQKAMLNFEKTYNEHISKEGSKRILIDQIVQNYSEVFSKQFSFSTSETPYGPSNNAFKKVFKNIVKQDRLKDVTTFTFKIGDFPDNDKNKGIIKSLKVPLTENDKKLIQTTLQNVPAGIDFKYPQYILINDQVNHDIVDLPNESISYLYKRTSPIVTPNGDATYERIEILGFKNISEFDFNNPNLVSSIKMNNVSRDENVEDAKPNIINQSESQVVSKQEGVPNPANYTNHSGGAALSDAEWDQIGREFGVKNHKHYREPLEYIDTKGQPAKGFENLDSKKLQAAGIKPVHITQEEYNEGAIKATQAFRMMFKDSENKSIRQAYIIRNWMQVKNADAVYALGTIRQPGENASDKAGETRIAAIPIVKGGTGYAVQMAINEGKPVYVFDGTKEGWYTYDYKVKNFVPTEIPTLTKNFAGIGSRSLSTQEVIDKSLQAIRNVYEKTFKSTQPTTVQTAEQVYSQLGDKTQSENVVIKPWNSLKDAKNPITEKGIISTRIKTTDYNFGNVFSHEFGGNFIKVDTIEEAVKRYINWILTGETGEYVFTGIQPEELEDKREWILEKLKSGELKGKPIFYYKELGEPSHATALDYLINKYDWSENTEQTTGFKTYQGKIESLQPNQIFVFGSNPQGRHGLGSAKQAKDKFGAVQFVGRGLKNQTYALVTKNLTAGFVEKETGIKYEKAGEKSLTPEQIQNNIKDLYDVARQNPDKEFLVAYSVDGKKNLNGYTDQDMADMFSAFPIPDNMVFEEGFSKLLSIKTEESQENIEEKINNKLLNQVGDTINLVYQAKWKKANLTYTIDEITEIPNGYKVVLEHIGYKGAIKQTVIIENGKVISSTRKYGGKELSTDLTKATYDFKFEKEKEEEITEEPEIKTTTVEYGGKTFIIEGSEEEGDIQAFYQAQGEKGKSVTDSSLLNKIIVAHTANIHPDWVVTLTNIQNQPKYLVGLEGQVISLQDTSYGKVIQSQDIIQRVMSLYYDKSQIETPIIEPQQVSETEDIFEEPSVETKPTKKEKRINVPKGSNPNNNVIMESEDTIFLMNDGQQEAYNFIKEKVESLLANKKRITESDLQKTVAFIDPLTQQFNGLIPMDMWNNMIGLAGRGGVGKTTVIKAIIAAIEGKNKYSRPSVMYLTPTHTAATVLQESLGLDSEVANDGVVNTIAAQTRRNKMIDGVLSLSTEKEYINSTQFKPSMGKPDIIIVDESSMIGKKDFADIILRLKQDLKNGLISRMPIFIFMGDYRQLGPIGEQQSKDVNKGLISSTLLLDKSKTKELTEVMRSDNELLHKIYDQVGNEIIENIDNLKNNRPVKKLSFDKYDKLTKQSSENILVVKNEDGVIDDYTDYLIQNNNPYGMFWVHYNNVEHGNTKNLSQKIRNDYFKKLGLDSSSPNYRLYANQDYIIFDGKIEKQTSEYEYTPSNDKIKKLLDKQQYKVINGTYTIKRGSIKPGARFKVLDIETKIENPSLYLSDELLRYFPKNVKVEIEHTVLYNRQDKIRHIHKILGFEVVDGKWNPVSKRMENIQIKNIKTGEIISKFDLTYDKYLKIKPELEEINEKYTPPFVPSYIGSSHTAQGNSIKNVIVGDYNIKKNAAANVNQDDIFSSMYVALTRTKGTLIIIKPAGADIINNQEVFKGVITDDNQAQRMTSASELKTTIEEVEYEEENETIDFMEDFFNQLVKSDKERLISEIFGENLDTKTILNNLYKADGLSSFYKQILSLVSKTGGVGNLKIVVDETMTNPGSYNRYDQTIRINPELAFESDPDNINALYDVIVHELLHHITANIIDADKSKLSSEQRKWVVALENLFKSTQEKLLNDPAHADNLRKAISEVNKPDGFLSVKDKSMYYGLTNIHDFVSMLMSDEKFRDFMNNTPYSGEKTLLDRFLDILLNIIKALGITINEDSVLKEGLSNVIGIIETRNQNNIESDDIFKSIKTKPFLDGIVDSEFDKLVKYLDIKTKCK